MIQSRYTYLILLVGVLGLTRCTDVITVDIEEVPPQLVVDAWIDNRPDTQTIRLTLSQDFFDNTFSAGVTNAQVVVSNESGVLFPFVHQGDGNYQWIPATGESIGQIGDVLFLGIEYNGATFGSQSTLNRVPEIDSIVPEFRSNEFGQPDGYYAQFYARDYLGEADTYWIKAYKNGVFLNKPNEMNLAYDSGFDGGSNSDGLIFITPIREAINRNPDPDTEDNDEVAPWKVGDEIRVEIHSITNLSFNFLQIARDQMNNGSNTIFAIPIANSGTNMVTLDDSKEVALGFFNVAAISTLTVNVE